MKGIRNIIAPHIAPRIPLICWIARYIIPIQKVKLLIAVIIITANNKIATEVESGFARKKEIE